MNEFYSCFYRFVCNAGPIAIGENQDLSKLLNFVVEHAAVLRSQAGDQANPFKLSAHRYRKEQSLSIASTVYSIREIIKVTREWYSDQGFSSPFLYISHDIYDSQREELLGVSVHFFIPQTWTQVKLPLGLQSSLKSKKAEDVADVTNKILQRYGIVTSDIFRGVSDNTNAAVLASHYIAGGRKADGETSTCGMHASELAMKHALGLVTRTKDHRVTDEFPEGLALAKKVHKNNSYLMDKKAKSRFKELRHLSKSIFQCDAKVLEIPNKTRVGGFHRMLESTLKSKQLIILAQSDTSFSDKFSRVSLKKADFQLIAEFEGVLKPLKVLSMEHQRDIPGMIAFSWLSVAIVRKKLFGDRATYKIVDVSKVWKPSVKITDLPRQSYTFGDLQETTKMLVERIEREMETYFPKPDDDQILAVVLHPVMVGLGMYWLQKLDGENFDTFGWETAVSKTLSFIFKMKTYDGPHEQIEPSLRQPSQLNVDEKEESSSRDGNIEADDFFGTLLEEEFTETTDCWSADKEELSSRARRVAEEKVKTELDSYIHYCKTTDWVKELERFHRSDLKVNLDRHKIERSKDPQYVGERFDVLAWWRQNSINFPHVAAAASIILAKPYHNGFQERVFSKGTAFDGNLRQNLKSKRYELQVVDALSGGVVKELAKTLRNAGVLTSEERTSSLKPDEFIETLETEDTEPTPIIVKAKDCVAVTDIDDVEQNIGDEEYPELMNTEEILESESDSEDTEEQEDEKDTLEDGSCSTLTASNEE